MPRDQYSPQADAEPGYAPGFWYQIAAGQVAAGAAVTANTLRLLPFQIRALVDVVALGGRITTLAASGNCAFGIYRAHGNTLLPVGRPVATTGSVSTTLAVNVNGALNEGRVQLQPGLYWFGVMADNATVVFQTITSGHNSYLMGATTQDLASSAAAVVAGARSVAATFGTWPDLTDPVLTGAAVGSVYCLGQFQVAPAS
jgi:hypothetical protein